MMEETRKKVERFLRDNRMHHEGIDMAECCDVFIEEMQRGLAGQDSSLAMIPTFIEVDREIPLNKPVIVLDAGGTHVRVATVYFNSSSSPVIEHFKKHPMPGLKHEVGKEEFFQTLAGYAAEIANASRNLGFCFSYPTNMLPNKFHFQSEQKLKMYLFQRY